MANERMNKVYVIGTLIQIKDTREGVKTVDGKDIPWLAGTAVVHTETDDFEFKYYSSSKTAAGKDNSRYANYQTLEKRIDDRVKISGELSGRVWYNEGQAQIINFNELSAGFFNTPKPTEEDVATFEYSGFVVKTIHERMDKEGEELLAYEMEIGQANYQGDNMQIVKFTIDKGNMNIFNAISGAYFKGSTVQVSGAIHYVIVEEEKVETVMFGDPIVKKFSNTRKSFEITGGKAPITDEGVAYTEMGIGKLEASYNAYVLGVEKKAKDKTTATVSEPKKQGNQGLL